MQKRVVVAGCRNYENYREAKEYIDFCISEIKGKYDLIFVSGGSRGTKSMIEFAKSMNKPIKIKMIKAE